MKKHNISAHAGCSAFFFFVSLLPMLIMICTIIPFTPLTEANLELVLTDVLPKSLDPLAIDLVRQVYDKSAGILSLSAVATLWSAGKSVLALMRGLNDIHDVTERRNYFLERIVASGYTLVLLGIVILTMSVLFFGNAVQNEIIMKVPGAAGLMSLLYNLRFVAVWGILMILFTLIYTYIPNKKLKLKNQIAGAVFAAVLWSVFFLGIFCLSGSETCERYIRQFICRDNRNVMAIFWDVYHICRSLPEPLLGTVKCRSLFLNEMMFCDILIIGMLKSMPSKDKSYLYDKIKRMEIEMDNRTDMAIPRPLHPTPDKVRKNWVNLNGEWEFSFDVPSFDKKITVPFSWESPLSGIGEEYKGTGWYRKMITYNAGDNRLFLHLGAVDYESDVFVNGVHMTHHFGGYTPIAVDVTKVWSNTEENEIIVRAVDADYEYQTYGKQGYGNVRGIWQTVWLEERGRTYIDSFLITTLCSGDVTIQADIVGGNEWTLEAEFACDGGAVVKAQSNTDTLTLQVAEPKLWTPESPNLYEGKLILKSQDGVDEIETYFGIREVGAARVDDRKRKYITLNGKPLYINGCLDQSFNAKGFFTFPEDEDCRREIEQMKDLGLNCARIHIKPEEPRKLYWADKLGLLIMEDIPCFWGEPNGVAKAFYEPQMFEVLKRDRNHPSIFYWVVFNETWGLFDFFTKEDGTKGKIYTEETQKWVVECYNKVKAYDPTRLVEDNSPCNRDHTVTDVNTWHFYANGYDNTKKHIVDYVESSNVGDTFNFIGEYACTDVPLMNSECGNVWGMDGSAGDSDISWHYKYMMNEYRLHDEICGFIFTEFRDVINEFNGYYRLDDCPKEFGYDGYVPGMTLKDLHSYDFLAVDSQPMKTCKPGEVIEAPLVLSSFTDIHHGKSMKVVWELALDTGSAETVVNSGNMDIMYDHYGCTALEVLKVKLPEENGVAKLRLYLKDAADNCIMRNFMVYDVQGEADALTVQPADFVCTGFKRAWTLQQDNKLNCIGDGTAEVTVEKAAIPGYEQGKDIRILFEASSKQELTKDRLDTNKEESIDLDFMRGYRVDRGENPNSYFQTDAELCPETILLQVEDVFAQEIIAADDPADSRGCLSWHYQPQVRKNEEAGSYGFVCEAVIPAQTADTLPASFKISLKGQKGFSVYGRSSGRYPIGFEISAK